MSILARATPDGQNFFVGVLVIGAVAAPWPFRAMWLISQDLEQMERQLTSFSVRDAECHCCRVAHKSSDGGEELLCDRALVYQRLADWFGGAAAASSEASEADLDAFDAYVQSTLGPTVLDAMNSTRNRWRVALMASLPWLWATCSWTSAVVPLGWVAVARYAAECLGVSLCVLPVLMDLTFRLGKPVSRLAGRGGAARAWLLSVLGGWAAIALGVALWAALAATRELEHPAPQTVALAAEALLCLALLRRTLVRPAAVGGSVEARS